MSDVRRLLLVRHGLPDYRMGKAGDEVPGPPLSALGTLQAQQAARTLTRFAATTIYTSPMARARQTAEWIRRSLGVPVVEQNDLREWHRTECLYDGNVRNAHWLSRWLASDERCAVVVGHASPLLAIIRAALYVPHARWHHPGRVDLLELDTPDRFEMSMAAVFALTFEARTVTAELVGHPTPRILDAQRRRVRRTPPRPVLGDGERRRLERPNFGRLNGDPAGEVGR
ncbi:MAG: phosphoglycerate mutase family protein [Phycisphaerae bacterium]